MVLMKYDENEGKRRGKDKTVFKEQLIIHNGEPKWRRGLVHYSLTDASQIGVIEHLLL